MWSRYPHGLLNQRKGFGNLSGQFSQALCGTCPWLSLSFLLAGFSLNWNGHQSPQTAEKKIKKLSAVPHCVWLLANRCFQTGCHWCFTLLLLSKASESRQKQLLLLEWEETLWDMSQIHGKESLMISAVHRSARVLGCFFPFVKILNCYVCLVLVFWLICLRFKVRKVKQRRIFVQGFFPPHILDSPLPLWSVPNIETKKTGCWLKSSFSAGTGAMCVNSESYNSAEPGEKATAAPQLYIAHLVASDTAILPTLQFFNALENYHCIYLHIFTHVCQHMPCFLNMGAFIAWTHMLGGRSIWNPLPTSGWYQELGTHCQVWEVPP